MTPDLFDVQCGFGGLRPESRSVLSVSGLLAELNRVRIGRALVRYAPDALDVDLVHSNGMLYQAARDHRRLVPCPVVVPDTGGDVGLPEGQVEEAVAHGARAVVIRPGDDHWSLEPWACDPLFNALQERRLPVLCRTDAVSLESLAGLAGRYPAIPFIALRPGYRSHRILKPLLRAFRNVYVSIGPDFTAHRGIESYAADPGADRLLFGSGLPETEPMAAICQLMYADIAEEQKALIGGGNLDRIVNGVAT